MPTFEEIEAYVESLPSRREIRNSVEAQILKTIKVNKEKCEDPKIVVAWNCAECSKPAYKDPDTEVEDNNNVIIIDTCKTIREDILIETYNLKDEYYGYRWWCDDCQDYMPGVGIEYKDDPLNWQNNY